MSLHYLVKLKMLIAHVLPSSVRERNFRIYSSLTVASKFDRFESSLLQSVGNIARGVQILITDLNSGVVDSSRSVMRVLYTFSRIVPTRCNQLDSNLVNLQPTVDAGKILELLSMTTQRYHVHGEYSQVSSGSVETLDYSGEMENVYMILQQIYSGNCTKFHQNRPTFS